MSKYKMVIAVRTDLGMGKGEMVTQGCHAAVIAAILTTPEELARVREWIHDSPSQTKIAVKVESLQQLLSLEDACHKEGIPCQLIRDAGKTQIEPGTVTVLGIGPDLCEKIDKITGDLSLL